MRYYPRGKVIRHFPLSNPHICPTNPLLGGGGGGGGLNIDRVYKHILIMMVYIEVVFLFSRSVTSEKKMRLFQCT